MPPRRAKPKAEKPAPPPKASVKDSLSWRVARIDLPCGHSVTRTPELSRQDPATIPCSSCDFLEGLL